MFNWRADFPRQGALSGGGGGVPLSLFARACGPRKDGVGARVKETNAHGMGGGEKAPVCSSRPGLLKPINGAYTLGSRTGL